MLSKKSISKINQISNRPVIRIRPPRCKFVDIARLLALFNRPFFSLLNMSKPSSITVILSKRTIRNYKKLHILKQARVGPKRLTVIPVNLIKSLFQLHTTPLQLNMHHGQAINQNSNIITVTTLTTSRLILVDNLQTIIMNISFINQINISYRTIITCKQLNKIFLNNKSLLLYTQILISNLISKKIIPLLIAKHIIIKHLQLRSKINN